MTVYRPKQRTVKARILTEAGWIQGCFNIPHNALFLDYMNRPITFDNLTQVTVEPYRLSSEFLMLQRRAIILIQFLEDVPELLDRFAENTAPRQIFCLLDKGIIRGSLALLRNIRVSDHFNNRRGFVLLSQCRSLLALPLPEGKKESQHPVLLLNTDYILGVSDSTPMLLAREPGLPPGP